MSEYYDSSGKSVSDGNVAYANDLNEINLAVDSGFSQVEADITAIGTDAESYADISKEWAVGPGEDPQVEVEIGLYASKKYSLDASDSATASEVSNVASGASETNALASANLAEADATQTALDRVATGLDATQVALDRVATGLDATATASDRVATGLDATATNADVVTTNGDVVLTNADVISSGISTVKAQGWAENPEDTPVEVGEYSALHWAKKAEGSALGLSVNNLIASSSLTNQSSLSIVSGDLAVTSGFFNYTNGKTVKGYTLSSREVTKTIDAIGITDGTYWISENSDETTSWYDEEPTYTGETTGVSFNTSDGFWYEDNVLMSPYPSFIPVSITVVSGEVTALGTDEISQSTIESLSVTKGVEVGGKVTAGEFEGPNALVAWGNVEAGTPPTIIGGYGILSVVRADIGNYVVTLEDELELGYSVIVTVGTVGTVPANIMSPYNYTNTGTQFNYSIFSSTWGAVIDIDVVCIHVYGRKV